MCAKKSLVSSSDYHKFSNNLIKLREIYGESQSELAAAIGLTKSAIGNYEARLRIPEKDELRAIAKHYNLTVWTLLNRDFTKIVIKKDISFNDPNMIKSLSEKASPLMCSDDALENESFQRAYEGHLKYLESWYSDKDDCENIMMDKCIYLYKQAGEDGIPEAYANVLGLLLLKLRELMFTDKTKEFRLKDKPKRNSVFGSFKYKFLPSVKDKPDPEFTEYMKNMIKEIRTDFFQNVHNLKSIDDSEFGALGDYYIALAYLLNVVGNGLPWAENRQIAAEMIGLGRLLHNKYIIDMYTSMNLAERVNGKKTN